MLNKKQIIKDYKSQKQPTGVYVVHNKVDNKVFIGTSKNLPAALRRFEFTLTMGNFPYQDLTNDYKKHGKNNFEVKILDELEIKDESERETDKELAALEEMWIEKLRGDGVNFYNKKQ